MGSTPQQAGSPMSSNLLANQVLARALPAQALASQLSGQPSGMPPPPQQPTSTPPPSAMPQNNVAPVTQQLNQATQPGSNYATGTAAPMPSQNQAGDSFVGQMSQTNSLASLLSQWGL